MTTVKAEMIGDKALISRKDLENLLTLAKRSEPIELQVHSGDISTADLMRLSEKGGSFDFWSDEGEDIYNENDGEPL